MVGSVTLSYGIGGLLATSPAGSTSTITPSGVTGGTFNASNYNIIYNTSFLTVSKAILTITASNQAVIYGSPSSAVLSAGSCSISGFVNGETASVISGSVSYNTNYISSTAIGASGITISPVVTNLSATNYLFTPANGTVSILSPTATFTWAGTVSTDWDVAANWNYGVLPVTTNSITIPSNAINQPILNANETIAGIVSNGNLSLNGYSLTVNGTTSGTGTLTGSLTSSLTLGDTSSGTLYFNQAILGVTNTLNNLIINTSGTISIGNTLNIRGTVTPTSGILATSGNLTLLSDSSGTARIDQVLGSISGNITVQRYIPAKTVRKYSFLGSPVSTSIRNGWQKEIYITGVGTGGTTCGTTNGDGGFTNNILNNSSIDSAGNVFGDTNSSSTDKFNSNGFDVTPSNNPSMFVYNTVPINGSRWVSIANTDYTNLLPGVGYKVNVRGDRNSNSVTCYNQLNSDSPLPPDAVTLSVTGTLNIGAFTVPLNDTSKHLFTLIANPYPSQISFNDLQASNPNINNMMWTYSPYGNGNYTSYSAGVIANGASGYDNTFGDRIANGQAFFVQANNNGSVTFQESHKTNGLIPNVNYFGMMASKMLRVGLKTTSDSLLDEAVVRFNDNGRNNYNPSWDVVSFSAANQVLYSVKGNTHLAISTLLNSIKVDTALLGISSTSSGTFKLSFSDFEEMDSTTSIVLVDKYLQTTQDIRKNQQYEFNVTLNSNSQGNNRFEVVFMEKVALLPVQFTNVNAKENSQTGNVEVSWKVAVEKGITLYKVERSFDGIAFSTIAITKATGICNYGIFDSNQTESNVYYRIEAISSRGTTVYSSMVKLITNHSSHITFSVFPNPVHDKLNFTLGSIINRTYTIKIIDVTGSEIYNKNGVISYNNSNTVDVSDLARGLYLIEITDGDCIMQTGKFIKN